MHPMNWLWQSAINTPTGWNWNTTNNIMQTLSTLPWRTTCTRIEADGRIYIPQKLLTSINEFCRQMGCRENKYTFTITKQLNGIVKVVITPIRITDTFNDINDITDNRVRISIWSKITEYLWWESTRLTITQDEYSPFILYLNREEQPIYYIGDITDEQDHKAIAMIDKIFPESKSLWNYRTIDGKWRLSIWDLIKNINHLLQKLWKEWAIEYFYLFIWENGTVLLDTDLCHKKDFTYRKCKADNQKRILLNPHELKHINSKEIKIIRNPDSPFWFIIKGVKSNT